MTMQAPMQRLNMQRLRNACRAFIHRGVLLLFSMALGVTTPVFAQQAAEAVEARVHAFLQHLLLSLLYYLPSQLK